MTKSDQKTSEKKIKIGDNEYYYDSLPKEAKQLVTGL
tara:strand:- start:292 stop:402 length:111 start_codon:yes stop_codon:yes gene_type:complete